MSILSQLSCSGPSFLPPKPEGDLRSFCLLFDLNFTIGEKKSVKNVFVGLFFGAPWPEAFFNTDFVSVLDRCSMILIFGRLCRSRERPFLVIGLPDPLQAFVPDAIGLRQR